MPEAIALPDLLLFAGILAAAGLVHGTLGLGFPVVATPLLALVLDVRAAILVTLLPTVSVNIVSVLHGGRWGESIGRFWPLAAWVVAGSVAGAWLLVVVDPAPFKLALAALVLLYLWVTRVGAFHMPWVKRHRLLSMLVFGLVAGMATGTTNVMLPVLIVYALEVGLERTAMVQVFNLCFMCGKLSQIVVFGTAGLLSAELLLATAPLAAVAVGGLFAGMRLRERVPAEIYRRVVRAVLLVLALLLVVQYFFPH